MKNYFDTATPRSTCREKAKKLRVIFQIDTVTPHSSGQEKEEKTEIGFSI